MQRPRGIRGEPLNPVQQFPTLFQGRVKLQGQYTSKLKEGINIIIHSYTSSYTTDEVRENRASADGERRTLK